MPYPHRLAVCSWSLRARSAEQLGALVRDTGLACVQLALDPIRLGLPGWTLDETRSALANAGITIISGMMAPADEDYSTLDTIRQTGGLRPHTTWNANREAAEHNAAIAEQLGIELVTLHAGCLPDDPASPLRQSMLERLRTVCEPFAAKSIRVAFETGQDSIGVTLGLLDHLADLRVGINFDPANMILYGSAEPVGALRSLASHVRQIHIKDAKASATPGVTWGEEVCAGTGDVDWPAFFAVVREQLPGVGVVVEREAGDDRVSDVRAGADLARQHLEIAP